MVKIVFDLLDVLCLGSKRALQDYIVSRFEEFCNISQSCNEELKQFASAEWQPEEAGANGGGDHEDRFSLIRAFLSKGCAPSSPFAATSLAARNFVFSPEALNMAVTGAELVLSSDAPIVRTLLGLHELADCTLWLRSVHGTSFDVAVLRSLPVAAFFEGVSKLYRVLNNFDGDSCRERTFAQLRQAMNARSHETIVLVGSRALAETAAAHERQGWIGVHLMDPHLNRAKSVERFSELALHSHPSSFEDDDADDDDGTPSKSPTARAGAASKQRKRGGEGRVEVASGLSTLGRCIIARVPELAAASVSDTAGGVSPMLFTERHKPIAKDFCICPCFWGGIAAGVAGTVVAMGGLFVASIVVSKMLRAFGVKKRGSLL